MNTMVMLNRFNKAWPGMKRCLGFAGIISFNSSNLALADAYAAENTAPYESCGFCHEYDGNPPVGNYPKLAGQKVSYMVKQLNDYKKGLRHDSDKMKTAAAQLSQQEMQESSEFYAAQKLRLDNVDTAGKDYSHAREICENGDSQRGLVACDLCHKSPLAEPEIPYISGQHAEYLENQLLAYRNGKRTNDEVTIMQFLSKRLSLKEIHEVSEYLAAGEPKP